MFNEVISHIIKYHLDIVRKLFKLFFIDINPLASPSAGAPALNYGDVNTVTPSPGEVKGLIDIISK